MLQEDDEVRSIQSRQEREIKIMWAEWRFVLLGLW